eukprot:scaffold8714_cov52-Phaeocystis_antarctica.AAC.2
MLDGPTDDKVHPEREAGRRLELRHVPPRAAQRPRRSELAEQRGRAAPLPPRRRHVRPRAGRRYTDYPHPNGLGSVTERSLTNPSYSAVTD